MTTESTIPIGDARLTDVRAGGGSAEHGDHFGEQVGRYFCVAFGGEVMTVRIAVGDDAGDVFPRR